MFTSLQLKARIVTAVANYHVKKWCHSSFVQLKKIVLTQYAPVVVRVCTWELHEIK